MPWLMKTEPEEYGLDDLRTAGTGRWDGVRNYAARNHMRACQPGDRVLIYHSGKAPQIVGIAEIARAAYPDPAQFDPESAYYDPKSKPDDPRWVSVDLRYLSHLDEPVSLATLKGDERFQDLAILRQSRLSVAPVAQEHYDLIVALGTRRDR
ncbi:MAG: EVE domain-containing protein [Deltaproteobacteria bacterium]|nr:EVE domain-containing protein [Deltaproteobacteria bacterium]